MRDVTIPIGLLPPELQDGLRAAKLRTEASTTEAEAVLQEQVRHALAAHFGDDAEDCEEVLSRRILAKRRAANEAAEKALDEERNPKPKLAEVA
jgi:hypothetical protein